MNPSDIQYLRPELIVFLFSLLFLVLGIMKIPRSWLGVVAVLAVVVAALVLFFSGHTQTSFFYGLLQSGPIAFIFRFLILIATLLIILLSFEFKQIEDEDKGEFYFFLLTLSLSMMIAVASRNLMMLYIAVEAVSIISYILIGYFKKDQYSSEAGLKYFIFGALSTGIMLYGITILYGLCRTLDIYDIGLTHVSVGSSDSLFMLAMIFVLAGLLFKCSLVPFHIAVPDAYQGAPTPVAAYLSIGPKAMGFALLINMVYSVLVFHWTHWVVLAQTLAMITMTAANITALKQTNVKRLLAYSSIAHAGFMLMALMTLESTGLIALVFYLITYIFMNVGAFGCVIAAQRQEVDQYTGLSRQKPFIAFVFAVALLSLAGLPPLSGFMAKFLILSSVINQKLYVLAIVAVLNSVVALYYYLRIIKAMYLSEPNDVRPIPDLPVLSLALAITIIANFSLGIYPQLILEVLFY